MAKSVPWNQQTDSIISDIDKIVVKKYNVSLRDLLLEPGKFINRQGFADTFKGIRGEVDAYFENVYASLKSEMESLNEELQNLTSQSKQISSVIESKAAVLKVPYIKPASVTRQGNEEVITIGGYTPELDAFIGKLVSISNYVADLSTTYKDAIFGSWLFSGTKNYLLALELRNPGLLSIQLSQDSINSMLNSIAQMLGQL